ncbi:MAG: fatty acid desaturase, partial [Myxococcota bacterium]
MKSHTKTSFTERLAQAPLPSRQFRRNRYFYLWYDGAWAGICLAILGLLNAVAWPGLMPGPTWWALLALPMVLYTQILGHVFVHNATHRSFSRSINRWVGELCGFWVVTRFASWEIVHQRHHAHADDPENDPHPVVPNFWVFTWNTLVNVETQLQRAYYERFGDTQPT